MNDIAEYISQLPEPQRQICRELVLDGEPVKDVAQKVGVAPNTVRKIARHALAQLADEYDVRPLKTRSSERAERGSRAAQGTTGQERRRRPLGK